MPAPYSDVHTASSARHAYSPYARPNRWSPSASTPCDEVAVIVADTTSVGIEPSSNRRSTPAGSEAEPDPQANPRRCEIDRGEPVRRHAARDLEIAVDLDGGQRRLRQ